MKNSAIATFALAAMLAAPSAAWADKTWTEPSGLFTVKLPDDWVAVKPDTDKITAAIGKLDDKKNVVGICLVSVQDLPATKGKSQAEIDAALAQELTADFWKKNIQAQGGEDVNVLNAGKRDQNGRKVHFVTLEMNVKSSETATARVRGREEIHAPPGSLHDIGCIAEVGRWNQAKDGFELVLTSYTPTSGLVASAPVAPQGSVLTLYANHDFGGVARVISNDTPDIKIAGWAAQTGSLTVSGFGEWQVCEGANYTGKCTVVVGAANAAKNALLGVGSMRRVTTGSGTRGLASSVTTSSYHAMRAAVDELVRQRTLR